MANEQFDLIVIGAGPGGYVAAIRAAQLGLKTALIEKEANLGGTCLNVGCIPSKALLHSTELYHVVQTNGAKHGIIVDGIRPDVAALMKHKEEVVNKLRQGVRALVSQRKVQIFQGVGRFKSSKQIEIIGGSNKSEVIEGKNILIATGSTSVELPFMKFDGETIISSDQGIALREIPKRLVVVGAGAIGLELGSVWGRLGTDVTVVEMLPNVAPTFDTDISKLAERIFQKQGIKFHLSAKVTGVIKKDGKTYLTAEKDGEKLEIEADKILVAVGRRPYTEGLGLETAGVKLDERKRIAVDAHFQTNVPGVYAIGDVIAGPMLAHKAEEEGVAAVEMIAGKAGHVNYDVIPNVVYTDPEISSVGISEQEAKNKGIEVNIGKFPFAGNGRALASDAADGIVKVIACKKTDKILGVQMIGKGVSEMIAEAVAHMEYGGSAEDVARTIHAHPTMSEAFKEAALAVEKRAIHSL
jgi:dihydrolipoamide dehydrogenase